MKSSKKPSPGRGRMGVAEGTQQGINAPQKRSGKVFGLPYQWIHKPLYTLKDWWISDFENDPYLPPEKIDKIVCGKISGHPDFKDGDIIRTSIINDAKGRFILTSTGTVYKLHGRPDKGYYEWMMQHGITYDGFEPLKIRK